MVPIEALEQSILNTIAYSDIFQYPLTEDQIHHYLIGVKSTSQAVRHALRTSQRLAESIAYEWPFYLLCGEEAIIQTRLRRAAQAERMWPAAIHYGRMVAHLPYVRMVAVTGALAMNNVDPGADIDYLIVTKPGRLWLCRSLVVMVVKSAGLRGVTLCPNYLVTEEKLAFPDQSLYAAHELAQMVPLHGMAIYQRMLQANPWIYRYLPNMETLPYPASLQVGGEVGVNGHAGVNKSLAEGILNTPAGSWLEHTIMNWKIKKYTSSAPITPEIDFCADWCKGHFDRHAEKTLDSYALRVERFGTGD